LEVATEAEDEAVGTEPFGDNGGDFVEAREPGGGVQFQNERLVVTVQNEAGPAVTFAIDPAVAGGLIVKEAFSPGDGVFEAGYPPSAINSLRFAGVKDAHANGRVRIVQADGEEPISAVIDYGQFSWFAFPVLFADAVREEPRMA
jgi:hypothetical protein